MIVELRNFFTFSGFDDMMQMSDTMGGPNLHGSYDGGMSNMGGPPPPPPPHPGNGNNFMSPDDLFIDDPSSFGFIGGMG